MAKKDKLNNFNKKVTPITGDDKNRDKLFNEQQRKEEEYNMENVLDFKTNTNGACNEDENYSIEDMMLNPKKRARVRKHFDSIYEETEEEKQIFESWNNRRIGRND